MSEETKKDETSDKPAKIEGQPLDRPNDGAGKVAVDERGTKNIRGEEDLPEDYDHNDPKK